MTISLIFLTVYIEFQKLLGNDDQNNIKHLHSVIKKRKEICHFTYRFQVVLLYPCLYIGMIEMLVPILEFSLASSL